MNNITKEIKTAVKKTLQGALSALEKADDLEEVNSALYDTKDMCTGIHKLWEDNIMDATLDAAEGNWSGLVDKICDDC